MRIRIVVVAGLLLALLVGIPHAASAAGTRTITAHVTVNSVVEPGAGIAAWPTSVPFNQRSGLNGFFAEMTAAGDATIPNLNTTDDYIVYYTADNITQFFPFTSATFNGEFGYVPADTTNLSGSHNFTRDGRTYSGKVERTGFETFGFHTAGVGACPYPPLVPALRPDGYCNGLRFTWADANGNYLLRLGPNVHNTPTSDSWNVGGFLFIDGRPVVGPVVNVVVPGGLTSEARNFSLDVNATPVPVAPPVGPTGNEVIVGSEDGVLNVASVPVSVTPVPPDVTFANGVISFTAVVAQGGTADIRLTFNHQIDPTTARWYKLRNGVWQVYPNVTFDPDLHTLIISVTDGDPSEDDDGIQNGYVTDPGALGVPTNPPLSKDQCKNSGWKKGFYKNQGDCVSHFAHK